MVLGGGVASFARSYPAILFGHPLAGVGGAILIVLMSKMLADWFAGKELFLGNAIFIVGWPAGIAAGQATQSRIAELMSWQTVFGSSTVLVALALVLMAASITVPPACPPTAPERPQRLSWPEVRIACLAGIIWMLLNGAYLVMLSFGPLDLIETRHADRRGDAVVSLMSGLHRRVAARRLSRDALPHPERRHGRRAGRSSIVLGAALPFVPHPIVFFILFGMALALATPVVGSARGRGVEAARPRAGVRHLLSLVFRRHAGPDLFGGLLRDWTGSLTATLLYADIMLLCTLLLAIYFRMTKGNRAVRS